jgi:hypothetical protein
VLLQGLDSGWHCSACSYDNRSASRSCINCGSSQTQASKPSAAAASKFLKVRPDTAGEGEDDDDEMMMTSLMMIMIMMRRRRKGRRRRRIMVMMMPAFSLDHVLGRSSSR